MSRHERAALEVQVNEFGQCPSQIFSAPHPPRLVSLSDSCPPGEAAAQHPDQSTLLPFACHIAINAM